MIEERQFKIRLDSFNLLKGLLIIYIVLIHKASYYSVNAVTMFADSAVGKMIDMGAVPAFFMIAGMTFRETTVKKYLGKTFQDLIKPYLLVMAAFAVCFPVLHYINFGWWPGAFQESARYTLAFLFGIPKGGKAIFGYDVYTNSTVWFFLALFTGLNILNLVLKVKNEKLRPFLVIISTVCGYVLGKYKIDYFCVSQGLIAAGYCYLGYLIKKYKIYANKHIPWVCILLLIPAFYQAKCGALKMAHSLYKLGYVECILAACSGMVMLFMGLICGRKEWKILDPIKSIGIYTYWILCIHAVEYLCVPWYHWSANMADKQLLAFLVDIAVVVVLLVAGCFAIKKFSRWSYRNRKSEKVGATFLAVLDHMKLDEKKFKIRLDTFNLLKGFLIIYVVLTHKFDYYQHPVLNAIFASSVANVLKSGAMPAFFIIAGMSFKGTTAKKCLSKTFKDLIIPYLYVMLAFAVCFPLIHYMTFDYWEGALREAGSYSLSFLLGLSKSGKQLFGLNLYDCSAVWFLIAMFIALNILNLLLKLKKAWVRNIIVIVLFVCGNILDHYEIWYYSIPRALMDVGYCYVGWLVKNHKVYTKRYLPILVVILAALTVYLANPLVMPTLLTMNALSVCPGLLFVFLGIVLGRIEWKILDPLKSIGVLSYWILCVHAIELRCIPWYKWSEYMAEKQILAFCLDLVFAGTVIAIFCAILKKISRWNYKRRMKSVGK